MPSRILREGILTSDRVNSLSQGAELFYRRLMSVVDDYGRFDGRPGLIRVSCFPLRVDDVREADISRWSAECAKAGLIALYAVDGKPYLELQDFNQQVRAKSKYPPPSDGHPIGESNADAKQMLSRCVADVHLVVVGDGGVVGGEISSEPVPASEPVSGFAIPLVDGSEYAVTTRTLQEWVHSFPAVDVEQELREMRAWALANKAKRKTSRGVEAFIVRWLGKAQDTPARAKAQVPDRMTENAL